MVPLLHYLGAFGACRTRKSGLRCSGLFADRTWVQHVTRANVMRCPQMVVPQNHPKLDIFSIETMVERDEHQNPPSLGPKLNRAGLLLILGMIY